jgi:hypothetical protein
MVAAISSGDGSASKFFACVRAGHYAKFRVMTKDQKNDFSDKKPERRYQMTLARVLATPSDHKIKPSASPKKRGRLCL